MESLWAVILDGKFSSFHKSEEDAEREAFDLEVMLHPSDPKHVLDIACVSR